MFERRANIGPQRVASFPVSTKDHYFKPVNQVSGCEDGIH